MSEKEGETFVPHYALLFAVMIPALFGMQMTYESLRLESPLKRIVIGFASLFVSVVLLLLALLFFPRLALEDGTFLHDMSLLLLVVASSVGLVFSIMMIAAGAFQGFKRWRYYRRNAR